VDKSRKLPHLRLGAHDRKADLPDRIPQGAASGIVGRNTGDAADPIETSSVARKSSRKRSHLATPERIERVGAFVKLRSNGRLNHRAWEGRLSPGLMRARLGGAAFDPETGLYYVTRAKSLRVAAHRAAEAGRGFPVGKISMGVTARVVTAWIWQGSPLNFPRSSTIGRKYDSDELRP